MKLETSLLSAFINQFSDHHEVVKLSKQLAQLSHLPSKQRISDKLPDIYETAATFLQQEMQRSDFPDELQEQYYQLFQEMESLIAKLGCDTRYKFIIVIPIADRPKHLKDCLNTLLTLCQKFSYGGMSIKRYHKIRVVIADDSKYTTNQQQIANTTQHFDQLGLTSLYFGPIEQLQQLNQLKDDERNALAHIIGSHAVTSFYHKGASITRNISYLKLNELLSESEKTLIWFLDSDQEFRVNCGESNKVVYAINYFHQINRIFNKKNTRVLTGKVVGDPPVSPAVMSANFLDDLIGFLSSISQLDPHQSCQFHKRTKRYSDDAAYHDMAYLFGFKPHHQAFYYQCPLSAPHDHTQCLVEFTDKLHAFFDGEHSTRKTQYTYQPIDASIKPARTVYTGNYILTKESLSYFIPFATLGLRMAGPVLGRILQSELGEAFVSANLPLRHKRTLQKCGTAEFRSGVDHNNRQIDLSGEFERQFFGDIMLFTIQELTKLGYPITPLSHDLIQQTISQVATSMLNTYQSVQKQTILKINTLSKVVNKDGHWWQNNAHSTQALTHLNQFLDNMHNNFGQHAIAYRRINTASYRANRCQEIFNAIISYGEERAYWLEILNKNNEHLCT
ncbi:MAG: hypothetical protein P8179_07060 [Candidatus Thiodiazotropha sp.]